MSLFIDVNIRFSTLKVLITKDALAFANNINFGNYFYMQSEAYHLDEVICFWCNTLYRGFYRSQVKISGPKMIDYVVSQIYRPSTSSKTFTGMLV